jgi:hypothetical protein
MRRWRSCQRLVSRGSLRRSIFPPQSEDGLRRNSGAFPQSLPLKVHYSEPRNAEEITVGGYDRKIGIERGRCKQRIDISNDSRSSGRSEDAADLGVPFEDWVRHEIRSDLFQQFAKLMFLSGWFGRPSRYSVISP